MWAWSQSLHPKNFIYFLSWCQMKQMSWPSILKTEKGIQEMGWIEELIFHMGFPKVKEITLQDHSIFAIQYNSFSLIESSFFNIYLISGMNRYLIFFFQFSCWIIWIQYNYQVLKKQKNPTFYFLRIINKRWTHPAINTQKTFDKRCWYD